MKSVTIETLSNKKLRPGQKLDGYVIKDDMHDESSPLSDRYLLRFFDEEGTSCGFALKTSMFSSYNSADIIQAMCDLKMGLKDKIQVEVISTHKIPGNPKALFSLKVLNANINNKILGTPEEVLTSFNIDDYVKERKNKSFDTKANLNNSDKKEAPRSKKEVASTKITTSNQKNINTEKKYFKADKSELLNITNYLKECNIPDYLIKSILSKHEPYEEKYLELIPHSTQENFKPWRLSKGSSNLLLLAITQMEEGLNMRFVGGKGAGKDTLLYTIGWIYQRPIFSQSASKETTTFDLFGDKNLEPQMINGTPVQMIGFQIGPLIEALEVGGIFEFGEGNACTAGTSIALHTVLDHRRSVNVNGYKFVKAHPNFAFILTMNVGYVGCNQLNEAFQDRFSTIKFSPTKDITQILKDNCPYADDEQIKICNKIYQSLLKLSQELQKEELVTVRGYINTLKMARHISLHDAIECCIANNISDDPFISSKVGQFVENIIG